MRGRLAGLARNITYYAVFASGLRRRNSTERARRDVYEWAFDAIESLLIEARALATAVPDAPDAVSAIAMEIELARAAPLDARSAHLAAVRLHARTLQRAAVGERVADRVTWGLERAAELTQRFALTFATAIVVAWLALASPVVRSVVLQSTAGLWSIGAFFGVGSLVVFGLRPLGIQPFFRASALPPEHGPPAWPPGSAVRQVLARFLLMCAGFVVVFGAILLFSGTEASFRTPFLLTTILCAVLMIGHGLDIWDYFEPRPVRFVAGVIGAVLVWAALGYAPDSPWVTSAVPKERVAVPDGPTFASTGAHRSPWIESDEWPREGDDPVVVVAASGGGSRAAMFAATGMITIDAELPRVASRIQALSGVSGGSLAMSGYLATKLGLVDAAGYARAMETDYVWPLLRAIVTLGSRAHAVENEWSKRLQLGSVSLASLARRWNERSGPPFPVPIFNSADMLGHPVYLSPFAPEFFDVADRSPCEEDTGITDAWVCDRDVAHTFQELVPGLDVPVLSAVRASANFPLAFPLIPIDSPKPHRGHAHLPNPRSTRITDGGVFLNSGVQGLYGLLLRRREELSRRGVLMIILDASAATVFETLPGEWELVSALRRAAIGRSQMLHRVMLSRLASELGGRFGCVLVDMKPTALTRIPTSWYLEDADRATIRGHYTSDRWAAQRTKLDVAFGVLLANAGERADVGSCFARPPLD